MQSNTLIIDTDAKEATVEIERETVNAIVQRSENMASQVLTSINQYSFLSFNV